jgi:hypothetical protein
MSEAMWDDQINDAARHVTATPPPPDLRRRVLERIATESRRPLRRAFDWLVVWKLSASAAGLGAAVIACIAVFAEIRGARHSGPTPAPVSAVRQGSARTTPTDMPRAPISVAATVTPAGSESKRTRRIREAVEVDAIDHVVVTPLTVDVMRVERLTPPDPIEVRELLVTPLSVTPLGSEDRPRD